MNLATAFPIYSIKLTKKYMFNQLQFIHDLKAVSKSIHILWFEFLECFIHSKHIQQVHTTLCFSVNFGTILGTVL